MRMSQFTKCPGTAAEILAEYDRLAEERSFDPRPAVEGDRFGSYAFDPGIVANILLGVVAGVLTELLVAGYRRAREATVGATTSSLEPAAGLIVKAREAREAVEQLREQGLSEDDAVATLSILESAVLKVLRDRAGDPPPHPDATQPS